ncbi:MAG TPA: DivIVA domain-containing protein [Gaiellaceae bacterium]|nr:DivIVA domain-containing protein [Gaiellaceae bacterium]
MSQRARIPASIRNVSFPLARRGYEQRAVDAYVTRINRLIAELEATHSPKDAVAHALERTEEERSAILTEAHERGAELVAAAQEQVEGLTAAARAEAADIVVNASSAADTAKAEADAHVAKAGAEAERIVADSQAQAAEHLRLAQEQIENLRDEAQAWLDELRTDTENVWSERCDLVDDLRELAARLQAAVAKAATTHPTEPRKSRHTRDHEQR